MLIANVSEITLDLKFKLFVVLKIVETLGNRCPSYSPYQQCPMSVQDECSCHADCDEASKYMCCFDGCRRRCRLTNATNSSMYLKELNLQGVFFLGSQYSTKCVELFGVSELGLGFATYFLVLVCLIIL